MKRIFCTIIIIISMFTITYAHSGRTDSNGGHYDRTTGEYHYHNEEKLEEVTIDTNTDVSEKDSSYNSEINRLQEQITAKESTIGKLNDNIKDKEKQIKSLENDIQSMWFGFIFFTILAVYVAYKIGYWNEKK